MRGLILLPPQELLYHCYFICQRKLFHIKCHSWNESLPSYIICLADSVVFGVLSKMITHRWYLDIIKYIHIISPIMRSTEMAILGLGSVLFSIPEATSINISRGGRQRNSLRFHSWFSQPLESHMHGYGGGEKSAETAGKLVALCFSWPWPLSLHFFLKAAQLGSL